MHLVRSNAGRALAGICLAAAAGLLAFVLTRQGNDPAPPLALAAFALIGVTVLASSLISRALFYVLVIPTTMPGAFFWKNKAFEDHARDIGLAHMPQVGVAQLRH